MKPFDEDLEVIHEWRAVFYNAEDLAENAEFANYDSTIWHREGRYTLTEKMELANNFALEKGFDTFEIESRKKEHQTLRFNTEATI